MKKLILIATILFFSSNVTAQITKGYWMVGGDANFFYSKVSKNNASDSHSFKINPNLGYFIKDNLSIGSQIIFQGGKNSSNFLSFVPFVRYYFLKSENKINYFSELSSQLITTNRHGDNLLSNYTLKAGSAFFLNDIIALEFTIKYTSGNSKLFNNYKIFETGIGLQIHLKKNN